jgi:Zn-dependent M28 family amino/carboxypeptidase
VVLGAHYDHLGRGWPDAREGAVGQLHPGADDNASGVAVLLELARVLGRSWKPDRSVVFAAFSGEEAGRLGSRRYVLNGRPYPAGHAIGMVNLDTVGRLGKGKLLVLGTGTAREWVHIFRGAGFVTGVPLEPVAKDVGGSDQVSFIEAGVPAVQLFTGPHLDYHRPSDTSDKVDREGLVKVASVVKEVVEYLAGREEPLTSVLGPGGQAAVATSGSGPRKVSLGTVPDFSYSGEGVLLEGVLAGSPAERAGLAAGDRIVRLGDEDVGSLADLARVLKSLTPGQAVKVVSFRGEEERTAEAVPEVR